MVPFFDIERRRYLISRLGPLLTRARHPHLFAGLARLCLFIGHGRSGSTLVGALLNAHPNIVMSNELDVLDLIRRDLSHVQLLNLIYYESRRHFRRGSPGGGGYTYAVPNQWQGRHREIRVIGDRKAGSTAIQLFRYPELLNRIQETIELPLSFVCVLRNPFDTITTTFRKTPRLTDETPDQHIRRQIDRYFERWDAISSVVDSIGSENIFFVSHELLVDEAERVLSPLCNFLGVAADGDYLSDCASIIRNNPHVTRKSIEWEPELRELVDERSKRIPWLREYEF